jgi:GNAT superfamily N-acetyltransferase
VDPHDVEVLRGRPEDLRQVVELYRAVGWSRYADDPELLRSAIDGSTNVVSARCGSDLVGLARVVSDGASVAYLQDVLVHPHWTRRGVGRRLVVAVLEPFGHVRQKILLADDEPGQRAFYESLGFAEAHEYPGAPLRSFVRFDG